MDNNKKKVMIKVENVSKTFILPHERRDSIVEYISNPIKSLRSPKEKFEVLKDVNFEVKQGEFVGIMGKKGSGKSTQCPQIELISVGMASNICFR